MARLLVLSLGLCFIVLYPVASRYVDVRGARQMFHKTIRTVKPLVREPLTLFAGRSSPSPAPDAPLAATSVAHEQSPAGRNGRRKESGRSRDFKLPAGTVISVQLRTPIDSGVSRVDEPVTAELRESIRRDAIELIPAGSVMFGKVAEVISAAAPNPLGRIVLGFHVIEHAETGHRAMIASRLVAFEAAVPEPAEDSSRRRKVKKEPVDVALPVGQPFAVTLAEPLLIRIPG